MKIKNEKRVVFDEEKENFLIFNVQSMIAGMKICLALDCKIEDVVEILPGQSEKQ